MSTKLKATILILIATAIWGFSFPINRYAMGYVDPMAFCGLRFLFGALALIPIAMRRAGRGPGPGASYLQEHPRLWLWAGVVTGLVLALATSLQYYGLSITTSAKSGFITGLYVTMVPLFGFVMGQLPPRSVWIGLAVGLVGLILISGTDTSGGFNRGDALTMVADLFWAAHVLLMGYFALKVNPWQYVAVQAVVSAVFCLVIAFIFNSLPDIETFVKILPCALYGILSVSVAYVCQFKGQKDVSCAEAALLMQLQSVIAGIAGVIFLGEVMTKFMWVGAFLMVAGSLIAQRTAQTKMILKGSPHFNEFLLARFVVAATLVSLCSLAVIVT
ncbi:MAG: DMT family transporter [Deltaproteobacteria bacterium]|jgi:drug/metabolite transporter (DMT)-like permease|nr:DMT family transporter [Deltaproteobacteria bacterium]